MDSRRFTASEKGKSLAPLAGEPVRKRIRAPEIDTSALIKDNALTLIGRVTNAREQPIGSLMTSLPRNWSLKGKVTGADLGLNCFQFRFDLEEDLKEVLANRPYHYHHWMVILQRWEPVISPTFPSQIPFWVRLQGLPLHFWHEKVITKIGHELGHLEGYHISKTSARVRVLIDGLKPLIMDPLIEFDSGEDLTVVLEYEELKSHCSKCFMLTHEDKNCPRFSKPHLSSCEDSKRDEETAIPAVSPTSRRAYQNYNSPSRPPRVVSAKEPFHQRIDRHGRPFGSRIPPPELRGQPLKNKLIPTKEGYTYRQPVRAQNRAPRGAVRDFDHEPHLQWRAKTPTKTPAEDQRLHTDSSPPPREEPEINEACRQPLGRNLALCDFPQSRTIPTTDEVLADLREVTYQYTNVADQAESAARRQRVLLGEEENLMATTAAGIIAAATSKLSREETIKRPPTVFERLASPTSNTPPTSVFNRLEIPEGESNAVPPVIQDRPASVTHDTLGAKKRRKKVGPSPRYLPGANSRKRNLVHASPARHGFPFASPIQSQARATPRSLPGSRNGQSQAPSGSGNHQQDFHIPRPPLP